MSDADSEKPRHLRYVPADAPEFEWRTNLALILTAVILIALYYFGGATEFDDSPFVASFTSAFDALGWEQHLSLLPFAYVGVFALVIAGIVPLLVILIAYRESPGRFGFRLIPKGFDVRLVLGALVVGAAMIGWLSTQPAMERYPFFAPGECARGGSFWVFQALFALKLIGLEILFRGYLLFQLERRFDEHAIVIATIPYAVMFFRYPVAEIFGAVGLSLLLGALALRTRSLLPGLAVVLALNVVRDLIAVAGAC